MVYEVLSFEEQIEETEQTEIKLAIIGRPNVGKSSLLNKILGEERVIVSPIAGTTRDAIDTELTVDGQKFLLIDTAGIRRKGKTTEMSEKLSIIMARKALERADVAILLIDAIEGFANTDANIAGYALDSGCSLIIAVNKWDAIEEKETNTANKFEENLRYKMKFLDWAPIITISALTGQRVNKILPIVQRANQARNLRVPTAKLNQFLKKTRCSRRSAAATRPAKAATFVCTFNTSRKPVCARRCSSSLLPVARAAKADFIFLIYVISKTACANRSIFSPRRFD